MMNQINPSISGKEKSQSGQVKPMEYYVNGIQEQNRFVLSEAITLLESRQAEHRNLAYQIIESCDRPLDTRRIAITGSPGVGKSTFIERLGGHFRKNGEKVAVLTIDPSSSFTSGSILGDKARMMELAKSEDIFIRPSPSSLHLGGIHQYTYEAILLCEAAGFRHVIIETVGVGQSEIEIEKYVDQVILLVLPGGGDSLQGIKKGIMEIADLIVINKADGNRIQHAEKTKKHLEEAQSSLRRDSIPVQLFSSIKGSIDKVIHQIEKVNGVDKKKTRKQQEKRWLMRRLYDAISEQAWAQLNTTVQLEIIGKIESQSVFQIYNSVARRVRVQVQLEEE